MIKKYIHISKYAKFKPKENRREDWNETVDRYGSYWPEKYSWLAPAESNGFAEDYAVAIESIRVMGIAPSMRALMTAGKALDRDHMAGYNCAGIAVNHQRVFDEIFFILMCGSGIGFSVERRYIAKLPEVSEDFYESETTIKVSDSKIGWASSLRELIGMLYSGRVPSWDTSGVRPAGSRLKTFGGRASGPGPLEDLFKYTVEVFKGAAGRRLTSLECFDLVCKIADTVIVGSVRRAATICLCDLEDNLMKKAKNGAWYHTHPHRALANISTAYSTKPDLLAFISELKNLHESRSGERAIINLRALESKAKEKGRVFDGDYLLNPCGESVLRSTGGVCNLSEVVVRPEDTLETLKEKVKNATILGTLQSTRTKFRYVRKVWRDNAEEERLLGVSLTGIMDHPHLSGRGWWSVLKEGTILDTEDKVAYANSLTDYPYRLGDTVYGGVMMELEDTLQYLKEVATETNKVWAEKLGIPPSKQLTLVKPSGTVSQLVDSSSGMHPRMFPYYIRNIRQDMKDPLSDLMIAEGIPVSIETTDSGSKYVFHFPMKSPDGAVTQDDVSALDQLELWKVYRDHWCDGNPSQTIHYKEEELFGIADWLWKNWDSIGGLSFFPKDSHIYAMPPYERIDKEEYERLIKVFPEEIHWDRLPEFEKEDTTTSAQEFACAGKGGCEL
ncbi:MAG: hypothetical protein KAS32_02545 [Candidatus Peribacteraceae bacterium]|nr:hypothetical protein [Candidatus Peribacteraceae bacterium]